MVKGRVFQDYIEHLDTAIRRHPYIHNVHGRGGLYVRISLPATGLLPATLFSVYKLGPYLGIERLIHLF